MFLLKFLEFLVTPDVTPVIPLLVWWHNRNWNQILPGAAEGGKGRHFTVERNQFSISTRLPTRTSAASIHHLVNMKYAEGVFQV